MIFHASFRYATGDRDRVHARFLETGGLPPDGVEMHGRWHAAAGNAGFLVAESDDAAAVADWLQQWSDLIDFELTPVVGDAGFAAVVG